MFNYGTAYIQVGESADLAIERLTTSKLKVDDFEKYIDGWLGFDWAYDSHDEASARRDVHRAILNAIDIGDDPRQSLCPGSVLIFAAR